MNETQKKLHDAIVAAISQNECPQCFGSGRETMTDMSGSESIDIGECSECDGGGVVITMRQLTTALATAIEENWPVLTDEAIYDAIPKPRGMGNDYTNGKEIGFVDGATFARHYLTTEK